MRWPIFSLLAAYVLLGAVLVSDCPDGSVTNVAFIPINASALVRRSSGEIELWDVPTGKRPFPLPSVATGTEIPLNSPKISCPRNKDNSTEDARYLGYMQYMAWGWLLAITEPLLSSKF